MSTAIPAVPLAPVIVLRDKIGGKNNFFFEAT